MPDYFLDDLPQSLQHFLQKNDLNYRQSLTSIPLFDPQKTSAWTYEQRKTFASIFYHLRGHFINFVWFIANFTSNELTKKIILENIHEELGIGSRFSHEMLFERFAKECDVDIHDEIINETHYVPFAKNFNKTHLQWLSEHDEEERVAAFAAYERLDNLDYTYLLQMGDSIRLSKHAKTFFKVHAYVTHFNSTLELIQPIWEKNPDKIVRAFHFIYTHQQQMWRNLSHHLYALAIDPA
ncbi:iron-containing redox enzyme family protein [Legionella parisiensis]|uniref:Thiaminase-2/PQQC domain-containing protein n=1 Tax=Legionella parisiensis TaxID=45071 RepID=A0A1E5JLN4_9GAMM|nr:iron-containing redox enzyme family protein [Legionella parisiensis]KTD41646.1 hypothetical protein Lpar_2963 [Legionella parisiensis]OEH45451.1 hypothetical protein lpari_03635 [Legionella parisiensis]STX76035.1 Uncharacterised protein [Legionella parisiensis]